MKFSNGSKEEIDRENYKKIQEVMSDSVLSFIKDKNVVQYGFIQ